MRYTAGTVTVPSSASTVSVSLPGAPALVVFQGTNFTAEDTLVTSSSFRSIFRGSCGRKYDDHSGVYQSAVSVTCDHGIMRSWRTAKAVTVMHPSTLGGTLYEASCSFTANGFDLAFSTAASGGYKVVYFAVYNAPNAVSMGSMSVTGFSNVDIGFEARSLLAYGQRAVNGTADDTSSDSGSGIFSSARWTPDDNTYGVAGCSTHSYPNSVGGQWYTNIQTLGSDAGINSRFGLTARFATFALNTSDVKWTVAGNLLTSFVSGADFYSGSVLAWDALSETGSLTAAATTGNDATVSGLPIRPAAGLFYGISNLGSDNLDSFANTGDRGIGYMLGVATPSFQWTACLRSLGSASGASFQSFSKAFCSTVNGSGAHTATVDFTADGFVATTADDDVSPSAIGWAVLGASTTAAWIPQIYRRV